MQIISFLLLLLFSFSTIDANTSEYSQSIKEKKLYPMGKKIFTKGCGTSLDLNAFASLQELSSALAEEKLCKNLNEKQLEALSIYLWEVERLAHTQHAHKQISVNKDEKCPVCGMYVYKYPRWAAQILYEKKQLSFDGVKDMMKFYFDTSHFTSDSSLLLQKSKAILVTDYYTQKSLDAQDAFYVLGSDVYGPMGNELIPFANYEDAKTFYMDHKGSKIAKFHEITKEEVYKLDE